MKTSGVSSNNCVPSKEVLADRLSSQFTDNNGFFKILKRESNPYSSTAASEVVTCDLGNGKLFRVFCKYSSTVSNQKNDHRLGLIHEAYVYDKILRDFDGTTAAYLGFCDVGNNQACLSIEYIGKCKNVNKASISKGIIQAARWIGQFHARFEHRKSDCELPCYDYNFFEIWLQQSKRNVRKWYSYYPWLRSLFDQANSFIDILLSSQPTTVHGEFYPKNILVRDEGIYPIDWESAARGSGEIDLAALIEGWPLDVLNQCAITYQKSRWPESPPIDFSRHLTAGRFYWQIRWLADERVNRRPNKARWRIKELCKIGKKWGIANLPDVENE